MSGRGFGRAGAALALPFALTTAISCSLILPGESDLAGQPQSKECADGRTACAGTCVDLRSDKGHCGRCELSCNSGDACFAGGCARPRFLSPAGADANPGTEERPWLTFDFAIPKLEPGDTLVLEDGLYVRGATGLPSIRCGQNAANGSAGRIIGIQAHHERQAHLRGEGDAPVVSLNGCSYWSVDGIHVASADFKGARDDGAVTVADSRNITLRRMLVERSNRYTGAAMIFFTNVADSLAEENEVYRFAHRALWVLGGSKNIFRRNYANGTGYPRLPDGPEPAPDGIVNTDAVDDIVENNVVEHVDAALVGHAELRGKYLANITIDSKYGLLLGATGAVLERMPRDVVVENDLFIRSGASLYARSSKNVRVKNSTAIEGDNGFGADIDAASPGDGAPTFYAESSLAWKNKETGFSFAVSGFEVGQSNAFAQTSNFYPDSAVDSRYHDVRSVDPRLGTCRILIPASSPMKGAGKDGADIGATILYRIEGGTTTTLPLWNASAGYRFVGCGVVVTDVNDAPDAACAGVHARLGVGVLNGCPLPY